MARKHQEREQSHDELQEQLKKLKKSAGSKKNLGKAISKLQEKMDTVIHHEKKIQGTQNKAQPEQLKELKNQVEQMTGHLKAMHKKVEKHIEKNKQLQESHQDLKAIIPLPEKSRKITEMKQKLKHLEEVYERYKNSGANNLDRVKLKIESIRARLAVA